MGIDEDLADEHALDVVDMRSLSSPERRETGRKAMLLQLLDRECAVCELFYATEDDLESHRPLGGYNTDIVGQECWGQYLKIHSEKIS